MKKNLKIVNKEKRSFKTGFLVASFTMFLVMSIAFASAFTTSEAFAQILPPTPIPAYSPAPVLPPTPIPVVAPAPVLPPTPAPVVASAPVLPQTPTPTVAPAPVLPSTSASSNVLPSTPAPASVSASVSASAVQLPASPPITTIVQTPPPIPTCSLAVSNVSLIEGGVSATLSWKTSAATSATIDNGIGDVSIDNGFKTVSVSKTTTYNMNVTGPAGNASCSATITVEHKTPTPEPKAPTCTLSASPSSINEGGISKLSWSTSNATSASFDNQNIGTIKINVASTTNISPSVTTKYTLTAIGSNSTAHCSVTVTVAKTPTPEPKAPTCTLSASPSSISTGSTSKLSWETTRASSFTINQNIGPVTPVSAGSKNVSPNKTITYTGTAKGTGGIVTCKTTVTVGGGGGGSIYPSCSLSISPSSISSGSSAVLSWGGNHLLSGVIDNGIGTLTKMSSSTKISPSVGSHKYTGTFKATDGETVTCSATLTVTGGGGGCTSNCGGGGSIPPTITLTQLNKPTPQPLAFVYLSQIPYTGLDLGPIGTVIYWLALIFGSVAVAYAMLFVAVPYLNNRIRLVGVSVREVLNTSSGEENEYGIDTESISDVQEKSVMQSMSTAPEAQRGYSKYDGFRSFASGATPTVEDIVKGLTRDSVSSASSNNMNNEVKQNSVLSKEPMTKIKEVPSVDTSVDVKKQKEEVFVTETPKEISTDTRAFIVALLEGDRKAIFATLRQIVRGGGNIERFLSDATCTLDNAYRARIDGTVCDPDIIRLSAKYATPVLENIITALTTAIDSSYTNNMTGAKLALTRALSEIGA